MFSFFTPAYNAGRYLAQTLDSVLAQTIPDWELVLVVDEASTDDTLQIAQAYAQRDPRIRVITVPHCTQSEKMTLALREMKYDWACGLDADDLSRPERLEVIQAAIEAHPQVIAWGGYARYFNNQGKTLYMSELGPTSEEAFHEQRQRGEPVMLSHSAMTFRRDIALELGGYDPLLFTCDDIDLCDRLSDRGLVLAIPQVLADYRIHETSTTASKYKLHAYQMRFIWERRAARSRGEALTWDEFQILQGTLAPSKYFSQWAVDHARFYWRQAGMAWGRKDYARLAHLLLLSTMLNPAWVARKLSRQIAKRGGSLRLTALLGA